MTNAAFDQEWAAAQAHIEENRQAIAELRADMGERFDIVDNSLRLTQMRQLSNSRSVAVTSDELRGLMNEMIQRTVTIFLELLLRLERLEGQGEAGE